MATNLAYQPGMQVCIAEHPQSKTMAGFEGKRGTIERILSRDVALVDLDGHMRQVLVEDLQPCLPARFAAGGRQAGGPAGADRAVLRVEVM